MKDQKELIDLCKSKGYDKFHPQWFENNKLSPETWYLELCLLQKWLRDVHKILVEVNYRNFSAKGAAGYFYVYGTKGPLYSAKTYIGETVWKGYDIYEEALEDALCQVLKLIK